MSERMSDERLNQCRLICSGEILDSLVAERDRVRELEAEVVRLKCDFAAERWAAIHWHTRTEIAETKVARVDALIPSWDIRTEKLYSQGFDVPASTVATCSEELLAALQEPEHE